MYLNFDVNVLKSTFLSWPITLTNLDLFFRNLREARNAAQIEQERLQSSEKDAQMKYNELIGE